MSWMNQLYKTYEANIGKQVDYGVSLCPIAHMNANAQLEVYISDEGEFISAVEVEKDNAVTLIPVTEASSGRSSGIAPHTLCDTLSYVAGDFSQYCSNEKEKKRLQEKYERYITNLKEWSNSEYTHPKIQAILKYLEKKCLIRDLINVKIVSTNREKFFDTKKISGQPYDKALVRFRVIQKGVDVDKVWEDESLISAYTNYYLSMQEGSLDICYFNGKNNMISTNHPKGIVAANYGAKLLSANDNQGYTFRGRFHTAEQAFSLSYEVSQKVHNALTWLAKNYGKPTGSQDKRLFICWNPNGKKTPNILDMFTGINDESDVGSNEPYKRKLTRMFRGYIEEFEDSDDIIVISLDAATTGRLSVTYYNELSAKDFWKRVIDWGNTCNWFFRINVDNKVGFEVRTPSFYRIVQCAFGRERDEKIEVDDRVLKEQNQRLLKCMLDGQRFPLDIMRALVNRASTPTAYHSRNNRERVLSIACAIIAKYYFDYGKITEGDNNYMKLDLDNQDRSYLFGRLLAVYEKVEQITYDRGEERDTNAIKLQSAFVNHPMQTWKVLDGALNPYFQKLKLSSREYYRRIISEITEKLLDEDEKVLNQGLKESYLLGYYLQRAELNKKNTNNKEEEDNE